MTLLLLAGCATSTPAPPPSAASLDRDGAPPSAAVSATAAANAPLGRQLARASEALHGRRFSGLLHFETGSDEVFIAADGPSPVRVTPGEAHTGRAALLLSPGTHRLTVKLSSLLAGREFPGDWALVGLYVRASEATSATLSCEIDGRPVAARRVALPAGAWAAAMLDLAALPESTPPFRGEATLALRFDQPLAGDARADDVLLVDNRETLVDGGRDGWTVRRAGLRITCERKLRFNFGVVTTGGSPQGWDVAEANALRARFTSSGETKALTVYADGRSIWDGAYKPLSTDVRDDPAFAAAHAAPAEVAVPESMGRLSRSTPGDADNDGYNERLGAYQVEAGTGRIELTLAPRSTPVPRPVLQIAGLPAGRALITIEGRLVEKSVRLPDGQLLVELPARITRPTLVTVRIH